MQMSCSEFVSLDGLAYLGHSPIISFPNSTGTSKNSKKHFLQLSGCILHSTERTIRVARKGVQRTPYPFPPHERAGEQQQLQLASKERKTRRVMSLPHPPQSRRTIPAGLQRCRAGGPPAGCRPRGCSGRPRSPSWRSRGASRASPPLASKKLDFFGLGVGPILVRARIKFRNEWSWTCSTYD